MSETKRETPPDLSKEKENSRIDKILYDLAGAFGGYSQLPNRVVGMAIIGQVNNNHLEFGKKQLDEVVNQIGERWEDQDDRAGAIRAEILNGMKEMAKNWPREKNERVWNVMDDLEE